jgi:hypothetical protein
MFKNNTQIDIQVSFPRVNLRALKCEKYPSIDSKGLAEQRAGGLQN